MSNHISDLPNFDSTVEAVVGDHFVNLRHAEGAALHNAIGWATDAVLRKLGLPTYPSEDRRFVRACIIAEYNDRVLDTI
jgi:penicillin V acylase-like amidase (Ntn superfamily)